jgi:hypothetical protein
MNKCLHSRYCASKGAALIIVLAFVVLATALSLAYFSSTTTDRQLAQTSYHDTSADLLARNGLDITVSDLKQEIANNPTVNASNIQPARYPIPIPTDNPNLIRYSSHNDARSRASSVISTAASADGRSISLARWNSHYLIPPASETGTDSTPVNSFVPPDWVLVTAQGPNPSPTPSAVIGRYAFAVYNEGGLMDMNLGGFPTYASLDLPRRPTRRLHPRYPSEESEIMLAAFAPNDPCSPPKFTPAVTNVTLPTGQPCSLLFNTNHNPTSFSASFLPQGLSINTTNGNITGTPTSPAQYIITLRCSNECGSDTGTFNLTITGFPIAESTPWPINLARKGTNAFADLTALPSKPTVITPTTSVGEMDHFLGFTQINMLMGWRNYATTEQSPAPFFPGGNPWFPLGPNPTATPPAPDWADLYAQYFLGAIPPFFTPYTTVSTKVKNGRTDQAVMTRQELIKLQRTIGFNQSLLQYLGTFSRERNRPAPDWPQLAGKLPGRWDMNNLQIMIPEPWFYPGNHGQGHAYGKQRGCCTDICPTSTCDITTLFGLQWVPGNFGPLNTRFTDPNYYGHWKYIGKLKDNNDPPLKGESPDFFQIIDYATNQAIGIPANAPNHIRNTFNIGAAIIDQYDTDDLHDSGLGGSETGNTITIIDPYGNDPSRIGKPANYAYGVEVMSLGSPTDISDRPPFAPYPAPVPTPLPTQANYVQLNRRFENVGEFGYACSPVFTLANRTLDFASATSNNRALLDFFTYNAAGNRAGIVNLNTRNGPVLASIIRGAWLRDPGYPEPTPPPSTALVSQDDALAAGQAIVQETTSGGGPVLNRADVARLAAVAAAAVPNLAGSDEAKETIARALAEIGQARTWNLMIDVIAQTGKYAPGTTDLTKFIVQGEKRYWLHIALDRDDGAVLGSQLEEVIE